MTATVTPIRPGVRPRKANKPDDAETISLRRVIAASEALAFEEQDADGLAMAWAMERWLPCNRLRLLAGTLDQHRDFKLRVVEADIARAEREAFHARIMRTRLLCGREAAEAMYPENHRCFERYHQAVMDMANTPATTRREVETKRAAIGGVWMKAEGAWYDRLRAGVAADEARLAAKQGRA